MRRALPKSLNGYLLLGIGMITVPLLAAILHATIQLRHLTDFSRALVLESVQTTSALQNLYRKSIAFERTASYYLVIGDAKNLASANDAARTMPATVTELRGSLPSAAVRASLEPFARLQQDIAARVRAPTGATPGAGRNLSQDQAPDFSRLDDQATRVATAVKQQTDAELNSLRDQADRARRELFWESSLLIPLALAATLSFALGIGRPLRQIDRAVTELGGGNFARKISVSGPVDLQRLAQQLEWLRSRLLDLAQERNRFLRHMSHALKTPLANIREGTALLMDGAVGELGGGHRQVATKLTDNSIKLQRMIENLLSYSAWQSNSVGLDPSEFRLRPLVKQVLENHQLTLVPHRVPLDVQVADPPLHPHHGNPPP